MITAYTETATIKFIISQKASHWYCRFQLHCYSLGKFYGVPYVLIIDGYGFGNYNTAMENRGFIALISEKAAEIIENQKPVGKEVLARVKSSLAAKGVTVEQSPDIDKWLISKGAEAVTFSDGMILMHTKVSASGFFEELIHYGQIRNGRVIEGDIENNLALEIEAKERLIKNRKAYRITDYEVGILTDILNEYRIQLDTMREEA